MASNGGPVPEVPSLDVAAALAPQPATSTAAVDAYTPLAGLQGATGVTPGALPLLVRMPDGERRQIELPPTATVRDLRDQLPGDANWDFNFNGQQLSDASTLAAYNIPDAYGHAGGLLKMITDSGNLDTTQKAELLKNACNVVQHISRGETDMERLISAALEDNDSGGGGGGGEAHAPGSPTQPSLNSIRRGKRSFMSLNFANLPPPGPTVERHGAGHPSVAPPTPSQLIQKLSASRPDLYPPTTASRMLVDMGNPTTPGGGVGKIEQTGTTAEGSGNAIYNMAESFAHAGSTTNGEFKRVNTNTWFNEFAKNIAPLDSDNIRHQDHANSTGEGAAAAAAAAASIGDSEDENPHDLSSEQKESNPNGQNPSSHVDKSQGQGADCGTSNATDSYLEDSRAHAQSSDELGGGGGGDHDGVKTEEKVATSTYASSSARESADESQATVGGTGAGTVSGTTGTTQSAPAPKKRGRKRKNPELSEEERKALRQAQNRASAKQSRLRRKEMAKEYQQRVNTLEGENEHLRDTVAALSDRLQFLQNLLTVSVQKRPPGQHM